jgi:hypothetical protein
MPWEYWSLGLSKERRSRASPNSPKRRSTSPSSTGQPSPTMPGSTWQPSAPSDSTKRRSPERPSLTGRPSPAKPDSAGCPARFHAINRPSGLLAGGVYEPIALHLRGPDRPVAHRDSLAARAPRARNRVTTRHDRADLASAVLGEVLLDLLCRAVEARLHRAIEQPTSTTRTPSDALSRPTHPDPAVGGEGLGDRTGQLGPADRSRLGRSGRRRSSAPPRFSSAGSHSGRFRSEAAFAAFAGAAPIPASSGITHRHRLNRGGDRQLNRALHTITLIRMRVDPATRAYIAKRAARGKTSRDAPRCIKRALAPRVSFGLQRLGYAGRTRSP